MDVKKVRSQRGLLAAVAAGQIPEITSSGEYDISSAPVVRVSGSSQPRVEASGSSQPRVEASGSSQPRVEASGSSQPRVEASDSSQLALENKTGRPLSVRASQDVQVSVFGPADIVGGRPVANGPGIHNFMGYGTAENPCRGMLDAEVIADPSCYSDPLYQVHVLGACTLVKRQVLAGEGLGSIDARDRFGIASVLPRFAAHPRGEDFPFCAALRTAGYTLFVHPGAKTTHYMTLGEPGLESWE